MQCVIYISNKSQYLKNENDMEKLHLLFLSDEGPMLETLDHTIRIGSTPTFLYFDLYLHSAYAAHYVYWKNNVGYYFKSSFK